ncbi:MAG: phosphoribosylformylglycinamidine synthase subunit PurQ [Cyanobacteriota bacterium]|nr:phosphoribosylformylglycinamidine synthase subunit PurQ [Cyanobacteriota bacterium]
MTQVTFGIVVFPGSNCDRDVVWAVQQLGYGARLLWHTETNLEGIDVVVLPGGFSYGDYLRCGAIARFAPIMGSLRRFAEAGGFVLGICNGFQILLEAGFLAGALVRNRGLRFICQPVSLRVERQDLPWTHHYAKPEKSQIILPIAHGEGCYVCDAETLVELETHQQIVFRYQGENPNGSLNGIAGICNRAGNVLGLMPHPERAVDGQIHRLPDAVRQGSTDGCGLWQSIGEAVARRQRPVVGSRSF